MTTLHKFTILIFAIVALSFSSYGQKESNIWHFGYGAGVDFNSGSPVSIIGGQINQQEGCSSISDANGNLLFYTDGVTVWNKNHGIMSNGNGLLGHNSSSQSAIIIPKPNSSSLYYIFTTDITGGPNGFNYSEVDITGASGLGQVTTSKNIRLQDTVCEKVTAVLHQNGTDIWVITHGGNNSKFYAYLVNDTGINSTPIISNTGIDLSGTSPINKIGYMKTSPNGKFLAIAHSYAPFRTVELFNFNNGTGIISNPVTLGVGGNPYDGLLGVYSVEFSPLSQYVYVGETDSLFASIYQYDLNASNIPLSEIEIGVISNSPCGAMQLGPDGKIYVAIGLSSFLGVINQPDASGTASDFNQNAVNLTPGMVRLGLPNFLTSHFNCIYNEKVTLGNDSSLCLGDTLIINASLENSTYSWYDGSIAPNNTITETGSYWVERNSDNCISRDTIEVVFDSIPVIDLGPDYILCEDTTITLSTSIQNADLLWQDSTNRAFLEISEAGKYWLTTRRNNCEFSDTITLEYADCKIVIPNIFTPNSDGYNDYFFIEHLPDNVILSIYNRWGKLTYQNESYKGEWGADGVQDGNYYYHLTTFTNDFEYKGWVKVAR